MIKRTLTLSLVVLTQISNVNAQQLSPKEDLAYSRFVSNIIQQQTHRSLAHKSTAPDQRLMAEVNGYKHSGGGYLDSARFHYSSDRGSAFNFVTLKNAEVFGEFYFPKTELMLMPTYAHAACDSMIVWTRTADYGYNNVRSGTRVYYRGNGNLDSIVQLSEFPIGIRTVFKWLYQTDNHGNVSRYIKLNQHQKGLDTLERYEFGYDASGRIIVDSSFYTAMQPAYPEYKRLYSYDAKGNLIQQSEYFNRYDPVTGPTWTLQREYKCSYDTDDRLTKAVMDYGYNGTMEPMQKDSIVYQGSSRHFTYWGRQNRFLNANAPWKDYYYTNRKLNYAGLPVEIIMTSHASGTLAPSHKMLMEYNSAGNPVQRTNFIYEQNTWVPDQNYITRYHYELYDNPDKVDVPVKYLAFPNPAMNDITVSGQDSNSKSYGVIIHNTIGKLVYSEHIPQAILHHKIRISQLLPGKYFICVVNDAGKTVYKESFIKL